MKLVEVTFKRKYGDMVAHSTNIVEPQNYFHNILWQEACVIQKGNWINI